MSVIKIKPLAKKLGKGGLEFLGILAWLGLGTIAFTGGRQYTVTENTVLALSCGISAVIVYAVKHRIESSTKKICKRIEEESQKKCAEIKRTAEVAIVNANAKFDEAKASIIMGRGNEANEKIRQAHQILNEAVAKFSPGRKTNKQPNLR